jgi:hypothetical protein
MMPPDDTILFLSLVERSGLMVFHDWPPLDVAKITWQP